ncbi:MULTISPECIES: ATP/GTP-binding protein [Campylobacter]|uniref:AAA family ATPase n=1 Tax=Campylobacter vicugnae TaxID=1660076 RepID=A0ABZ2E8U9_9BACT|nr:MULTISPECIES: AAA family ATPase [unclassified Campylobacter]ARR03547.1 ATPase, AAA family [Campylobacter sp. RM12175]MCR8689547.1 ATP-binding protein [Campylobacter sp. RM9264]MCR8701593.1 ATP-binding protein [Campylobacter sp. RM12176]
MIKYFKVSGYKSIKEPIELDLNPKGKRIKGTKYEYNYFNNRLPKSVFLFGQNAVGKTNVLESIDNLFNIINKGIDLEQQKTFINASTNELKYHLEVICGNDLYTYKLEINQEKILYEYLSKNNEQFYEFKDDTLVSNRYKDFKSLLSVKSKTTILQKLKDNIILEISEFIEYDCMFYKIEHGMRGYKIRDEEIKIFFERKKDAVINILTILDNSITDFYFLDLKDNSYKMILKRGDIDFGIELESSGIKKIIWLVPIIIFTMENGGITLIDELDSSIGTISLIRFLNSTINSEDNKKGQFLISTHNPLLFDTELLSPDQIYIVTKEDYATKINSLDSFELRKDKRKAYLNFLRGDYE